MRGKSLKVMGLGVAAVSLFAAPSAHAAIAGATPSSFGDRPNLSSVKVTEDHNIGVKSADFCFDRNVQLTAQALNNNGFFHLVGYASNNSNDNTNTSPFGPAFVEPLARNCVRAYFNIVQDVVNATVGTVDQGAVRDDAGGTTNKVNLSDAAPLTNSQQGTGVGNTVGPNITSVVADTGNNTLRVTYDRVVNFTGNQNLFHYYDQAGNLVTSDGVINAGAPNATVLIVHFPGNNNHSVRDAVRFVTENGAITDASGQNSPIASSGVTFLGPSGSTTSGETARPDLIGARISGPTSVDYTFDEPVKVTNVGDFDLYNPNRERQGGQVATPLNSDNHVVRVFFGPNSQDAIRNGLVLAAVEPGAVRGNDSAALINTFGAIGIGQIPNGSGFTSAPDVTGLTFNKDDGTATLTLDQELGQTPNANDFHLYDCTGNDLGPANQAVVTGQDDSTAVQLIFGQDRVENACAVGLVTGALRGQVGDRSVEQIVARNATAPIVTPSNPGSGSQQQAPQQSGNTPAAPVVNAAGKPAVGAVSPATINSSKSSLRVASAKLKKAKSHKASRVLRVRVNGKAKTARIKIQVIRKSHGKSKVVRTITRTVRTNRTVSVRVGHLKKGQAIRVRLA